MVWNTSTTNDFPNVARGLKIKILASKSISLKTVIQFWSSFWNICPPRLHHPPFLPNSIEKKMFSELLTRFREMKVRQWISSPA